MIEDLGAAANQALYGNRKSSPGLGSALYQIKEEKRKGINYVFEKATFYKEYVVMETGSKQCCFPVRYNKVVLPKYKLCRARVNKAARGFKLATWGLGCLGACIICFILSAGNNGTLTALAVILLMFGLLCLLFPCCLIRYETELTVMLDPEHPNLGQKTYYLRTFKKPDDDFILLYVYGSVVDGMSGYHALAHLVDDNLVQKVQPLEMSAVSVSKDKLPASGLIALDGARRSSSHATNAGYGNQLYVLEQTTGIFGEEGGLLYKMGTSISKTTTRAVFCENLIVLQIENKLLCYPMTYEKIVIPKYRVASVQFNKGGVLKTLLAVSWIIFWIGLVIVVLGAGASAASNTLSGSDQTGGGSTGLIIGGVATCIFMILLALLALCHSTYEVIFSFIQPPQPAGMQNGFTKAINRLAGPETYSIVLHDEPNTEFVMSYVYGTLGENMGGYHALTHLIKENLVEKVKPFTIGGAIAGTGKPSYVPVPSSPAQIDVAPTMADGEEAAAVPDGWRPVHDMGTGRYYYYNTKTGESTWIKPA